MKTYEIYRYIESNNKLGFTTDHFGNDWLGESEEDAIHRMLIDSGEDPESERYQELMESLIAEEYIKGEYYLAPPNDPKDRYAAGYDGNNFESYAQAFSAIDGLRGNGKEFDIDWIIVEVKA